MLKEATISKQKIVNAFTELSEESSLEQINHHRHHQKSKSQQTNLLLTIQIKITWLKLPCLRF